jgi:hypothetical protein
VTAILARIVVASLVVGLTSFISFLLGRIIERDRLDAGARAAEAVQEGMRTLDAWATSDRDAFFDRLEMLMTSEDERKRFFAGVTITSAGGSA